MPRPSRRGRGWMCMMCREKFKASPVRMADLELAFPGPKHPIPIPMLRRRVSRPAPTTTACLLAGCPLFLRPGSGPETPPCLRLAITLSTTKAPGRLWFRCLWGTQLLAANTMCDGGEKGTGGWSAVASVPRSIRSPFFLPTCTLRLGIVLFVRRAGQVGRQNSNPVPHPPSRVSPNHPSGHQGDNCRLRWQSVAGHGAAPPSTSPQLASDRPF